MRRKCCLFIGLGHLPSGRSYPSAHVQRTTHSIPSTTKLVSHPGSLFSSRKSKLWFWVWKGELFQTSVPKCFILVQMIFTFLRPWTKKHTVFFLKSAPGAFEIEIWLSFLTHQLTPLCIDDELSLHSRTETKGSNANTVVFTHATQEYYRGTDELANSVTCPQLIIPKLYTKLILNNYKIKKKEVLSRSLTLTFITLTATRLGREHRYQLKRLCIKLMRWRCNETSRSEP